MAEGSASQGRNPGGASGVVLATKLYIPPIRPDLVPRPRLVSRLENHNHAHFTLVSAPAGFGKTTLISEWVGESRHPVAWISLEESENDPSVFLEYLVAALRTLDDQLGSSAADLLRAPRPPEPKLAVTHLINEIAEKDTDLALVLDDYHVVTTESIHDTVAFLVEHLPPQLHLVITTRSDPPFPLARWRARGRMHEVRAADLRFETDETEAFLNNRMGLHLSSEDLTALTTRTEGWITGLQLAAISLRSRGDASEFVRAFAGDDRFVLDYLAEEVLHRQPDDVQRFLLRSSVLGRLGASLCDAVTEEGNAREMLERLERENLFLTSLDGRREWYRYHHLFADLLRYRLEADEPDVVADLHVRASTWFEQEGLMNEAIHHARSARDWERVLRLVSKLAQPLMLRRQIGTLAGWLKGIPDEWLGRNAFLCGSYALALVGRSDWAGVERALMLSKNAAPATPSRNELAMVWNIRAYMAYARRDPERARDCAARARELVDDGPSVESLGTLMASALALLAEGSVTLAEPLLVEALAAANAMGHVFVRNASLSYLAQSRAMAGRLVDAAGSVRELLDLEISQFPEHVGYAHALLGDVARERNDLDTAATHVDQYLEVRTHEVPQGSWVMHLDRTRSVALIAWALGDRARAFETIATGIEHADAHGIFGGREELEALRAVLEVRQGNVSAASHWAAMSGLAAHDPVPFEREAQYAAFARVLAADGRAEDALGLAERMIAAAAESGRLRVVLELETVRAIAFRDLGRMEEAIDALERALALAEREGIVRIFVDEAVAVGPLFAALAGQRRVSVFAATIVPLFGEGAVSSVPSGNARTPWWYEKDPLHKREIEVLQLVAEGLSNDAIATRLFIAVSTVKRHVANIYQKLDVHSRTQAVARGRSFGFLE